MRLAPRLGLRIELEVGDAVEMARVVGHQNQVVVQGRRRNEQIQVADELPLGAQRRPQVGKTAQDGAVQRQHLGTPQETQKDCLMTPRILPGIDPLIDLALGDEADGKPCVAQRGQRLHGRRTALQILDHPAGIDQIAHSSTGGREERRPA